MIQTHLIFVYPIGHRYLPVLQDTLDKYGKISKQITLLLTSQQALGFILQLYLDPSTVNIHSLMNKLHNSGWTTATQNAPLTVYWWVSSTPDISNQITGKGSPFKCFIRFIAAHGQHQNWNTFSADEIKCKQWKTMLHIPDHPEDLMRLIPLVWHKPTRDWTMSIRWESVIPFIQPWLKKYYRPIENTFHTDHHQWSSSGKIINLTPEHVYSKGGVFWSGLWMTTPPITIQQWKDWINLSVTVLIGDKHVFLWSFPTVFKKSDIKNKTKNDYLMSWKANGIHGILEIKNGLLTILNEYGNVRISAPITSEYFTGESRWEGEWIEESREFIAFDLIVSGNFQERIAEAEKKIPAIYKQEIISKPIQISDDISFLWKTSQQAIHIAEYLKRVKKTKYISDGLIFTPRAIEWDNLGKPVKIIKWKPVCEQTVDVYIEHGKAWLTYLYKYYKSSEFHCENNSPTRGMFPRHWNIQIKWADNSITSHHDGEIWELRWMHNNNWEAVRRRDKDREKFLTKNNRCDGNFFGPNPWKTMQTIWDNIKNPISVADLENW